MTFAPSRSESGANRVKGFFYFHPRHRFRGVAGLQVPESSKAQNRVCYTVFEIQRNRKQEKTKMATHYEWEVQSVDEHGDIVGLDHGERGELSLLIASMEQKLLTELEVVGIRICLVRWRGNEVDGAADRRRVYVTKHESFEPENSSAFRVPKAFHTELHDAYASAHVLLGEHAHYRVGILA